MTEAARDLYLLVAVLGLLPAVTLAGMPVLAQSAFVAVGGVGALQLERAGLPIGGAVLIAIVLGAVAGAGVGALGGRAEGRARPVGERARRGGGARGGRAGRPPRAAVRRTLHVGDRLARLLGAARL